MKLLLASPVFQYLLIGLCVAYILFAYAMQIFCKRNFTKTLSYIAIGVYLLLFFALALVGVRMDVLLCLLMALLFVYVLMFYIRYRAKQAKAAALAGEREESV